MKYRNEELCVEMEINEDGSSFIRSTSPSKEPRLFDPRVEQWQRDTWYKHFNVLTDFEI